MRERVGGLPALVQRAHQQAPQPLVVRIGPDMVLKLFGHRGRAAEFHQHLRALHQKPQPQIGHPGPMLGDERTGQSAERRTGTPEGERLVEGRDRRRQIPLGPAGPSARRHPLGHHDVEAVGTQRERVPRTGTADRIALPIQGSAQTGHVRVQIPRRRRGRRLAPHVIDQVIARNNVAPTQRQDREDRPLLRRTEHEFPLADERTQRPEGLHPGAPVLHASSTSCHSAVGFLSRRTRRGSTGTSTYTRHARGDRGPWGPEQSRGTGPAQAARFRRRRLPAT